MKSQDIVILLKIISNGKQEWQNIGIAKDLKLSPSTVSESLERSRFAGLIDSSKKKVMKGVLLDFLAYGIKVVFPTEPSRIRVGIPTAHSAPPLSNMISSKDIYVWASSSKSMATARGESIEPLHKCVINAVKNDEKLYEMLALIDAIRVGKARERNLAVDELKKLIQ